MHLTTLTDYALRVLMHVAQHPDRLCTIAEVAERHGISKAHLMKVTHRLALGGWLETVRGRGGGMRLARAAQEIRLGDVVRCIEPDFRIVECFDGSTHCALEGHCRLAEALDGALSAFHRHLDEYTLQDILPRLRPNRAPVAMVAGPRRGGAPAPGSRPRPPASGRGRPSG